MLGTWNPEIGILFAQSQPMTFRDRFELPLFFILGGVDDSYLSQLVNLSVSELHSQIQNRSVDAQVYLSSSNLPIGVWGSRASLTNFSENKLYFRTFPLSSFLKPNWPVLDDLSDPKSLNYRAPDLIQQTWIVRALKRNGLSDLYEKVRFNMLTQIYPTTLNPPIPSDYFYQNLNSKGDLIKTVLIRLSEEQLGYNLTVLVDDLPLQHPLTFGKVREQLLSGGCTQADLRAIQTSIELLSI